MEINITNEDMFATIGELVVTNDALRKIIAQLESQLEERDDITRIGNDGDNDGHALSSAG